MAGPRLTYQQREILRMLRKHPGSSARRLTDLLDETRRADDPWSMGYVTAALARMDRRGLVWHDHARPRRWQITFTGETSIEGD